MYYNFNEKLSRIPSHRILAINRGEKEGFLKVKIDKPEEQILTYIERDVIQGKENAPSKKVSQDRYTNILKDGNVPSDQKTIASNEVKKINDRKNNRKEFSL